MRKINAVIRRKTNGASEGSLAFQSAFKSLVMFNMTNGLTGVERIRALNSLDNDRIFSRMESINFGDKK